MAKLNADVLDLITSKPGEPLAFKTFTRGDDVTGLSAAREAELKEQGVLVDKLEKAGPSEPPGESKAPKGDEAAPVDMTTEPADVARVPSGSGSDPVLTADAAGNLTGEQLKAALEERNLSTSGSVAEKQQRLVEYVSR